MEDARLAPRYMCAPRQRERVETQLGKRDGPDPSETVGPKKKPRKRAHYLQHSVRCAIIHRVAQGEPQAALAREFGVTRAAVCQMYKNREEILAREDSEDEAEPQPLTLEARSKTVQLLLTTLKDARSSAAAFRRASARLTFILIEETLASYDPVVAAGKNYDGNRCIPFCGVALGEGAASFTAALCQIEPDAPTGQIQVKSGQENGRVSSRLVYLDVPANITECEVLLFSASGNGADECKAIEALCSLGVVERSISLVMVVCSTFGYEEISSRFPDIAIIPATIDDEWRIDENFASEYRVRPLSYEAGTAQKDA